MVVQPQYDITYICSYINYYFYFLTVAAPHKFWIVGS